MSKILALTGATGPRSGGALAEQLSRSPEAVAQRFPGGIRALARPSSDTGRLEALLPQADIRRGELTDPAFLEESLRGADTLLHIAGIHWSREVVRAAARAGVRRLILVHTTGIYSKYKEAGEEYRRIDALVYETCREHGIRLTVLRPTMIYGNPTDNNVITFIKMVDRLPVMPVVNGARYELQPVHYRDLGEAYFRVLMNEDATADKDFILSGGAPIRLREMLSVIGRNLGKRVRFFSVPFPIAYAGAAAIYRLTGKRRDYREKVQRLCEPRAYPHEEAAEAFGYAPMTFEQGIADEVRMYKERC